MNDWNEKEGRKAGTWKFLQQLDADPQLRQNCLKYPWTARNQLEQLGQFSNMPASVEIRVLEDNKGARDNLHIIALPEAGQLDPWDKFNPDNVWLGCWSLWKQ